MASVLRVLLAIAAVLGYVVWAGIEVLGLMFCEAYNCDMSVTRLYFVLLSIQLVAVGGLCLDSHRKPATRRQERPDLA